MKLNLNPKELLALHNLLHSVGQQPTLEGHDVHLVQVYNRLRACVLSSLAHAVDPVEAFFDREQQKIDRLESDLDGIRKQQASLPAEVMGAGDDDTPPDSYPRKGHGSRQRKHRGGSGE